MSDPRAVLRQIRRALRPGGVAVFHEYLDYGAWTLLPPCEAHGRFVAEVMTSWRAEGGEPDVGRTLTRELDAAGFAIERALVHAELVAPADPLWRWPIAYVEVGAHRLVELGRMTAGEADALVAAIRAAEADAATRMLTPVVLEVLARAP